MTVPRGARGLAVLIALVTLCAGSLAIRAGKRRRHKSSIALAILAPPRRPSACDPISAGAAIQPRLDSAPSDSTFCLGPGRYRGPLVIGRPVTLWGPREAVIESPGEGSTIMVETNHVRLLGFTIHGSGERFDRNDSGVRVTAQHVLIEGLKIENALFGLTSEESGDVIFRGNLITGDPHKPIGLRGDAVRLWETHDSMIEGNEILDCRDILIWYSERNRVANNTIENGRYGTHFMFSKDETVENNRYSGNVVGIFAMYSHGLALRGNWVTDSSSRDGMGIGVKDSDQLAVADNALIRDSIGIYLDASPADTASTNFFSGNLLALNAVAVDFHAGEANTEFRGNTFRNNQSILEVEGQDNALQSHWSGNYFDDYQGYDLNHDGRGDVPYELRSFSTELTEHYPLLTFFAGSPALGLLDFLSHAFPLLQPKLLMVDRSPRMTMPALKEGRLED